ncbi:uncharacterized protein BXZ73DRAFT_106707 [Epithele typhae]|uniref:uncharacterized protein n=1 Tax=Epithele typhae TaxID=378194 RepID=UPI0020074E9E|nr:uncharacterized protein BXZ73DRAFT_106707 [Epithele typhae]KAH9914062.1 hypothetical protein BXZ73DRAFT_106707 [Epithele typhae]
MVDFGTAVGIVASVLGILTACITAYLSKVQADGLVQEVFFATTSHNIADIELDVMELHGVLYQERPWFKRLAFWVTTWINVRIYCRNLKQIQADIALHASTFRREKERSLQALKSEASAHVKSEDLDDDAKLPTFPLGDAVLDQLECRYSRLVASFEA